MTKSKSSKMSDNVPNSSTTAAFDMSKLMAMAETMESLKNLRRDISKDIKTTIEEAVGGLGKNMEDRLAPLERQMTDFQAELQALKA